jgi:hypothetical protein
MFACCPVFAFLEGAPRRVPEIIITTVFLLAGVAVMLGMYLVRKNVRLGMEYEDGTVSGV